MLQGNEVVKPSPQCGFVFQSPNLLEWKTVMDNVLLPIKLKRKITKEDRTSGIGVIGTRWIGALISDRYPLTIIRWTAESGCHCKSAHSKAFSVIFGRTFCRIRCDYKRRASR